MAIDNRLQIFDENGNPVDYDIMATDVKFADGKDLPTKLDELEDEIGEGGYTPPEGGIPKTDLAQSVRESLDKADNALQSVRVNHVKVEPNNEKEVDITVPTKVSQLENDSQYGTVQQVKIGENGTPIDPQNGVITLPEQMQVDLTGLFGRVAYDNITHRINFYGKDDVSLSTVLAYVDASPFIIDGMLSGVVVRNATIGGASVPCMVFSFNTDAGLQDINVPISDIFNAANYYTKSDADAKFVVKEANKSLMTDAEHNKLASLPTNSELQQALDNAGTVKTISVNGVQQSNNNGNVNITVEAGAQGPKGDTGNVQVDGNGNVLIVNNVDEGGTGAALSAEMGKRLALKSGTFAAAWARAQVIPVPFSFLWVENISGVLVRKPIWHIGNSVFVDAAGGAVSVAASAVPNAPTFSETSGSTIGKNTQLTITPAADSALYYKIDNGNWIVSDVAVIITITATCTITAKCVNNAGSSSEVQCALTVSGPQVPQFAAADGTTIGTGNVVSRGGSVVVSVPEGGELHYSTDGENYTTASGLSVTIPVPAAGVHIWAYNIEDGEQSATRDVAYTMAALAAPTLSPATGEEFPAGGGSVTISASEGDGIKYTTDGSDPTSSQTATAVTALSATVNVTSRTTIKAVAYDDYGTSAVTEGSYTVETAKLKVTASSPTTMTLTKTDDSTVPLTIAQGDNEFEIDTNLGGITTFKSCAFGDKTLITKIDFGGITINSIASLFQNCSSLLECKNLFVNGSAANAFNGCLNLAKNDKSQLSLGGKITHAGYLLNQNTTRQPGGGIDLSRVTEISNISNMFCKFCGSAAIDLSHTVVNIGNDNWNNMNETFFLAKASTLIIGKFDAPANSSHVDTFRASSIKTIKCTDPTPPALGTDWVADFKSVAGSSAKILVPNDYLEDYKSAAGWSNYADIMEGY